MTGLLEQYGLDPDYIHLGVLAVALLLGGLLATAVSMGIASAAHNKVARKRGEMVASMMIDSGCTLKEAMSQHGFTDPAVAIEAERYILSSDLTYATETTLKLNRAGEIAEELLGTAKALHDVVTDAEQNDLELLRMIDQEVFCCSSCGWWCETSEANEAPHGDGDECEDCHEKEDYDYA